MTLSDFIENVEGGGFIDYDGFGVYLTDDHMTNHRIYPSDLKNNIVKHEYKRIIWFNR